MNFISNIIIFLLVSMISYNLSYKNCKLNSNYAHSRIISQFISLIHCLYSTYFFLGSLIFGNHLLHFVICSVNICTWIYYRIKNGIGCPATYAFNFFCEPKSFEKQHRDIILYMTDKMTSNENEQICIIVFVSFLVLCYDLFHIFLK